MQYNAASFSSSAAPKLLPRSQVSHPAVAQAITTYLTNLISRHVPPILAALPAQTSNRPHVPAIALIHSITTLLAALLPSYLPSIINQPDVSIYSDVISDNGGSSMMSPGVDGDDTAVSQLMPPQCIALTYLFAFAYTWAIAGLRCF